MTDKVRAATIRPAELRHLLRVTSATSRHSQRDALVLLLGHTCAMRVTEIARVLVSDVLMPSGTYVFTPPPPAKRGVSSVEDTAGPFPRSWLSCNP